MRLVTPSLLVLGLCTFPIGRVESSASGAGSVARVAEHSSAPARAVGLDIGEREALRAASLRSPELGRARAGDVSLHLSDREVRIIAIAVVITLVIVLLA